jgi:hypothetical protein
MSQKASEQTHAREETASTTTTLRSKVMDPNLFHLDWEKVAEVLAAIVVMAFLIERALSLLFGNHHFVNRLADKHIKELISFALATTACWYWDFDALSMIFLKEQTTFVGVVITGGVVAGGSKGAVKLFTEVIDFRTKAEKARAEAEEEPADKTKKTTKK